MIESNERVRVIERVKDHRIAEKDCSQRPVMLATVPECLQDSPATGSRARGD
jgi:hypothetical protein